LPTFAEDPDGYPEPVIQTPVNCNSVEYSEKRIIYKPFSAGTLK